MALSLGCLGLCLHKLSLPCQPGGSFHSVDEEVEAQRGSDTAIKRGSQDLGPGLPWLGHQARLPLEMNKTSKRNILRPGAACAPAGGPVGLQKGSRRSQEWRRQGSRAREALCQTEKWLVPYSRRDPGCPSWLRCSSRPGLRGDRLHAGIQEAGEDRPCPGHCAASGTPLLSPCPASSPPPHPSRTPPSLQAKWVGCPVRLCPCVWDELRWESVSSGAGNC